MKSKFRKLFLFRMFFGFIVFFFGLMFLLSRLINFDKTMYQELILVSVLLLFLMYVSIGLLKVCSLELSENGLTKTLLFSRKKYNLDFADILKIEKQKTSLRDTRLIDISDAYYFSILKIKNNKYLVISPDYYENYPEILEFIKNRVNINET